MRRKKILLVLALAIAPLAPAQQFVLVSFNTLHYGWGNNTANKDAAIVGAMNAVNAGGAVLQEIMPQANFANLQAQFPPGTVDFLVSVNAFGTGAYRERYLILLQRAAFTTLAQQEYPQLAAPGGPFSRPPMLAQVRPNGSAIPYFIGDFHAIWGRRQAQRTAEAAAICAVLLPLVNSPNVALAGDWNLTAPQVLASAPCLTNAGPAGLTTLNRGGTQYSSSYDHAVATGGGTLTFLNSAVLPVANTQQWRQTISDHVPIAAVYGYQ